MWATKQVSQIVMSDKRTRSPTQEGCSSHPIKHPHFCYQKVPRFDIRFSEYHFYIKNGSFLRSFPVHPPVSIRFRVEASPTHLAYRGVRQFTVLELDDQQMPKPYPEPNETPQHVKEPPPSATLKPHRTPNKGWRVLLCG